MTAPENGPQLGRPREFDTEAVLETVVDLFWTKGFGATSVSDIVRQTGLSKSSLYGAFGSKEELFEAALGHYLHSYRRWIDDDLTSGTRGLDDIEAFFSNIGDQARLSHPRGCLGVNTATELGDAEPALVALGARHRDVMREGFTAALARAADGGEIEAERVTVLGDLLVTATLGLGVMVRGGASADEVGSHVEAIKTLLRQT